jgi:NAD(P)H dehydrogenase (quinone)
MKHAVVIAHPRAKSFTHSVADAWQAAVASAGHAVLVRDLYAMDFDPRLAAGELPFDPGFAPGDDVKAERALLGDADVFVFVYPLWFNAPPAILKGYCERVFGPGFAYAPGTGGSNPLLTGRKLISFTSSGAPTDWVESTGAFDALTTLFDKHFAEVCGLSVVDHVHFGYVVPGMRTDAAERLLARVPEAFARHFPISATRA